MQIPAWTLEFQSPVGQRDGSAGWSDSLSANTGKPEGITFPSARIGTSQKKFLISVSFTALLAFLLVAYFCRYPRGVGKLHGTVIRRLAGNEEDEACKELRMLVGKARRENDGEPLTSHGLLQSGGHAGGTGSRKRGPIQNKEDEGAQQAKKPFFGKEMQYLALEVQDPSGASPRPFSEASSAQRQIASPRELHISGAFQTSDEASTSSVTEGLETASSSAEPVADFGLIEEFFAGDEAVEQWFLDYILYAPSASPQEGKVEHLGDLQGLADEALANAADQHPHKAERQTSAAHGSAVSGAQVPAFEADDVQEYQAPPSVSAEQVTTSSSLQQQEVRFLVQQSPEFKSAHLQAASSTLYSPPTFTGGPLPSTTELQAPGLLYRMVGADKGSPEQHPFYRLPKTVGSAKLIPFSLARAITYSRRIRLPDVLIPIHDLLIKRQLVADELQLLITLAEKLVIVVLKMRNFTGSTTLSEMQEPVMRRFIIADAFWSICDVVGPPMRKEGWWDQIMNRLVIDTKVSARHKETTRFRVIHRFIAALLSYQAGFRPSAREVVELKREVFCSPDIPLAFRATVYDIFRDDDGQ